MTFRIESVVRGGIIVFRLSGRIESEAIDALRKLFEVNADHSKIVLDLKDVGVVDRNVVCFFVHCEAQGVNLENCPAYVREWMEREKD